MPNNPNSDSSADGTSTMLPASYRGIEFAVISIKIGRKWALSAHEIAYQDGAQIENLGQHPDDIHIKAIFYGDDFAARADQFNAALASPGPAEFIHPWFGSQMVEPQAASIDHEADHTDSCTYDLHLKATEPAAALFAAASPSAATDPIEETADQAEQDLAEQLDAELPDLADNISAALLNLISARLSAQLDSLASLTGTDPARLSSPGQSPLIAKQAWLADLITCYDTPINQLSTAISANTPASPTRPANASSNSSATGTASQPAAISLWRNAAQTINNAQNRPPASTTPDWRAAAQLNAPPAQHAAVTAQAAETCAAAIASARTAAILIAQDLPAPQLTPPEIETITNHARTLVSQAINLWAIMPNARTLTETLRNLALTLQQAEQTAINARPPLVQRPAPFHGNLTLIAHAWYKNWQRAAELARLNPAIINPNFISAGTPLNAYAE